MVEEASFMETRLEDGYRPQIPTCQGPLTSASEAHVEAKKGSMKRVSMWGCGQQKFSSLSSLSLAVTSDFVGTGLCFQDD